MILLNAALDCVLLTLFFPYFFITLLKWSDIWWHLKSVGVILEFSLYLNVKTYHFFSPACKKDLMELLEVYYDQVVLLLLIN